MEDTLWDKLAATPDPQFPKATWLSHQFHVCRHGDNWHAVAGLYVFARRESDSPGTSPWRALYVGQTTDFCARLPTHDMWPRGGATGCDTRSCSCGG